MFSSKILHKYCFQFLLGRLLVLRQIENNVYAKFWGESIMTFWIRPQDSILTCVWRHEDFGNLFQSQRFPSHYLKKISWTYLKLSIGQNRGNNFPVTSSSSVLLFLIDHGQQPIIALVTSYSPHFITKIIWRVCTQPGTFSVRHS